MAGVRFQDFTGLRLMDLEHMVVGTSGTSIATQGALRSPLNPDSTQDAKDAGPTYPYGLRLCLTHEELAKLGVDAVPSAGKQFHIEAMGVIISSMTGDYDSDGDVDTARVDLQITHLAFEHEGDEEQEPDHAARMYGPREG
jgi:hypothetical protein